MNSQNWGSYGPTPRTNSSVLRLSSARNDMQSPGSTRPVPGEYIFDDRESVKRAVSIDYLVTEELGMGAFGVVKKAVDRRDQKVVAIKCIRKGDCKPEELVQEVRLQRMLSDFEGIVKLEQVYESRNKLNIIMEYISGGELFDAIVENDFYSESDAAALVKQIVTTVEYIHSKNVVHRDLKLYEIVGSRTYMAPEIHMRTGYGKLVDMYAIGVIMYILLCGYPPFDYDQGIYELAFGSPEWDPISTTAKDIIKSLLDADPNRRPTASQLKVHHWVSGKEVPKEKLENNIHKSIRNWMDTSRMKARIGGDRGGYRPRVMSIFQMFNNASQVAQPPKYNKNKEQELIEALKMDINNHGKVFLKLTEEVHKLGDITTNEILKDQMDGIAKDLAIMTNAHNELQQGMLPKLNKALASLRQ